MGISSTPRLSYCYRCLSYSSKKAKNQLRHHAEDRLLQENHDVLQSIAVRGGCCARQIGDMSVHPGLEGVLSPANFVELGMSFSVSTHVLKVEVMP